MDTENSALREKLRKRGIAGRDALPGKLRRAFSDKIAGRVSKSEAFKNAGVVMIYRAVRGEADLSGLCDLPAARGKTFVYPKTYSGGVMDAYAPLDASYGQEKESDAPEFWISGPFGIPEPNPEYARKTEPAEIDLVICPCTAFDEECTRLGHGAGYYDRFLPLCVKAHVIAVAFEAQKMPHIPSESWDIKPEAVYTETAVYLSRLRLPLL